MRAAQAIIYSPCIINTVLTFYNGEQDYSLVTASIVHTCDVTAMETLVG